MRTKAVNQVAGGRIPEPRGAVGASGGDEPAIRSVPDREDLSCMPGEPHELLACDVANARRPALQVGCDEASRVGREGGDVSDTGPPPDAGHGRQHARGGERVVERLLGLGEHGAVMSPRCFGGFDREQDAALGIDLEVRLRRRRQLAGRREACVVSRLVAEDERERCERRGRRGEHREPCQRRPPPPRPPPGSRVRRRTRLGQELALAGGQREVGRARPGFELGKPALARQVTPDRARRPATLRPPRRDAGGGGGPRGAPRSTPVAGPTGQDRLVRDLDGRRPRHAARGRR